MSRDVEAVTAQGAGSQDTSTALHRMNSPGAPRASPSLLAVQRGAFVALGRWLAGLPRPAAAALATVAAGLLAYTVYRAVALRACDLVHGYLVPARGIVFEGRQLGDFAFNSFTPFLYVVMAPLALLPTWLASLVWSLGMGAMLVAAAGLLDGLCALAAPGWRRPRRAAAFLLAGAFVLDNLFLGQSNVVILYLLAAFAYAALRDQQGRAGLLLAVAAAFKVTPALLAGVLVLRGRWRALAGFAAGLALCLGGVPLAAFGPERGAALMASWSAIVLTPFVVGEQVKSTNVSWYHTNQSMEAFLQRSLTPYAAERYGGLHAALPAVGLTEAQVHRVASGMRLGLLALLAAVVWRGRRVREQWLFALALAPFGMLWLSPASWNSHYVLMVFPYAVALTVARTSEASGVALKSGAPPAEPRGRAALLGSLAVAVVTSTLALPATVRSYSPIFLAHVPLFAALVAAALRARRPPVTAG